MKKRRPLATEKAKRTGELIPSGSTLLNLALGDDPYGAYKKGSLVNEVGDSSAGKTMLAWSMLAEVVHDKAFDEYDLFYDDVESKLQFDLVGLFGEKITRVIRDEPSDLIEEFGDTIFDLLKEKKPFIYVLDSFDALSDKEERAKKELKREYPLKPKLFKQMLRIICKDLEKQESLLVIISQTYEKIGIVFGEKKGRAGGHALRYHAMQEYWLAIRRHIKRRERDVGVRIISRAKKNHLTGRLRQVELDLLWDYGIDNTGSLVDWMVNEEFWKKPKKGRIIDTYGDFEDLGRESLITHIEEGGEERKLIEIVSERWQEIEESVRTDRKGKYA